MKSATESLRRKVDRSPIHLPHILFLLIVGPTALLLCFIIGPFEGADETAHYLRMVAIANGHILPVISPPAAPKLSAGAYEDAGPAKIAMHAQDSRLGPHHYTLREIQKGAQENITGNAIFAPHSNTAIYPPFLYAASAAVTFIAERLGLAPLWWLYLGRLVNAVCGIWIIYLALRKSVDSKLVLFSISILPITLYQLATVSADALLFPLLIAFVVLLLRTQNGHARTSAETFVLSVITVIVCAGKVAYLPLAILPPIAARCGDGCWSRRALFLASSTLVAIALWGAWAFLIRDDVFSIRPNLEINPSAQIKDVILHPISAGALFLRTTVKLGPKLVIESVGARLGWGDLSMPRFLIYPFPFLIAAAALPADQPERRFKRMTTAALIAGLACFFAIFLLIYMQFNAVGASEIEGLQGRYFTPIAIILLALTPRLRVRPVRMQMIWGCMYLLGLTSAAATLFVTYHWYW